MNERGKERDGRVKGEGPYIEEKSRRAEGTVKKERGRKGALEIK